MLLPMQGSDDKQDMVSGLLCLAVRGASSSPCFEVSADARAMMTSARCKEELFTQVAAALSI